MFKYSREYLSETDKKIKKVLSSKRYIHTVGVRYTAAAMAMRYGCDISTAELAGILHDCAKNMELDEMLKVCEKGKINVTENEKTSKELLHSKAGMCLAGCKYKIEDEEIISAIEYHTTGTVNMTLLQKIIFIADFIEPSRDKAECLEEVRRLAFEDIDECMYVILRNTLNFLESGKKTIDRPTYDAFEFYKKIHESKQ